jgi:hypothetical protein
MAGPVASEKSILQTTNFSVHLVICLYVPEHQKSVVLVLPLLRLATNLASPCLLGRPQKKRGSGDTAPSLKSIISQRLLILRQRCEATSFHSLQIRQSASFTSKVIAPTISYLPNNLLAYPTCHPPSASASLNHFDRPSSAHDKQSSAAIKPPQGPQLLTALPLSPRVYFGDYGRARSESRLFISGTTYSTPRRIFSHIGSSLSNSLCRAITDI